MNINPHNPLTASELSLLWTSYLNDSMATCGISFFLEHVEDEEIRKLLEFALDMSKRHVAKVTAIFNEETYPLPQGFTEEDVNLQAPRLFSDVLYLHYIANMGKFGLTAYSVALSTSSRDDIVAYYSTAMQETIELHNWGKKLMKKKGIYTHDPSLPTPRGIDFVKNKSFLKKSRPLLGVEIANLWYNSLRNALGQALIQGFAQVAEKKEVRHFFARGREIAGKHFKVFNEKLHDDYIGEGSILLTSEVTDSQQPPFSDKLMMYHITTLIASAVGQYGAAISSSPRHDLGLLYTRLCAEIINYAADGAHMMIENGWMEQPPQAADRRKLAE